MNNAAPSDRRTCTVNGITCHDVSLESLQNMIFDYPNDSNKVYIPEETFLGKITISKTTNYEYVLEKFGLISAERKSINDLISLILRTLDNPVDSMHENWYGRKTMKDRSTLSSCENWSEWKTMKNISTFSSPETLGSATNTTPNPREDEVCYIVALPQNTTDGDNDDELAYIDTLDLDTGRTCAHTLERLDLQTTMKRWPRKLDFVLVDQKSFLGYVLCSRKKIAMLYSRSEKYDSLLLAIQKEQEIGRAHV